MRRLCGLPPGVVLATVWSRADSARGRGPGHLAVHRSGRRALGVTRRGRPAASGERPAAAPAGADAAAGTPARSRPDRCLRRRAGTGTRRLHRLCKGRLLRQPLRRSARRLRGAVGERAYRPCRLGARGARRLAQGRSGRAAGYLPLTEEVITAHLSGELELGLYPLLDGDRCQWLAADFDGPAAMLDALAYLKAARTVGTSAALEVSRSGLGAHVWLFFTAPLPAATARQVGTGLLREAIAVRGRMDLTSYDRLFPSQDVVQIGGLGNLIAAPLQGRARRRGATVFLDLATMEPHEDQWTYLSSLGRRTPQEVNRLAQRLGQVAVGVEVNRLRPPPPRRSRCSRQPWCRPDSVPGSRSKPQLCPQRCSPHSSTRRRCPTRSSTSGNGAGPPPGTPRASCATTTRRSPATCSCRAGCRTGSQPSWNRPAAAWSSPTNGPPAKRGPSRSLQSSIRSNSKPSKPSPTKKPACWSPRPEPARRSWPVR